MNQRLFFLSRIAVVRYRVAQVAHFKISSRNFQRQNSGFSVFVQKLTVHSWLNRNPKTCFPCERAQRNANK